MSLLGDNERLQVVLRQKETEISDVKKVGKEHSLSINGEHFRFLDHWYSPKRTWTSVGYHSARVCWSFGIDRRRESSHQRWDGWVTCPTTDGIRQEERRDRNLTARQRKRIGNSSWKVTSRLLHRWLNHRLSACFNRIKQAIGKKDEQVQTLRTQFEAAVKRADHLEGLLAQQRKLIGTTPSNGTSAPKKTWTTCLYNVPSRQIS